MQWLTLTDDEWGTIALLLQGWWPGAFSEADELAWRMGLDGHSAGDIAKALKAEATRQALSGDGGTRRWRPSLPEVLSHLVRQPARAAGLEISDVLWGPGGVMHARAAYPAGGWRGPGGRRTADNEARLDAAVARGPHVRAFLESVGVDQLVSYDPCDVELTEADQSMRRNWLAKRWEEFLERADERGVHALLAASNLDPLAELRRRAGEAQASDRVALEDGTR